MGVINLGLRVLLRSKWEWSPNRHAGDDGPSGSTNTFKSSFQILRGKTPE